MENQQLVSPSRQCSITPVGFGQGFLSSDITDLAPVDFYLFPRLKSALKGQRYCGAADFNKDTTEELKRLHKMASRNVSNTFTVSGRNV